MFKIIKSVLLAVRVKTLSAALVPVIMAASLVVLEGLKIDFYLLLYIAFAALFIQIATNFFNDAIDSRKGADKVRIGPQRMTQSGELSEKMVLGLGVFCCLLAFCFGVPIVIQGGWPIVIVGVISIFLAYGYTGGPFPLAYLGLGDLFVMVFFGWVACIVSYYLFTNQISYSSIILGTQVGALSTVLIAINNLRDSVEDKKVSKNTLAVKFGDSFVKKEILFLSIVYLMGNLYWFLEYGRRATPLAITLPLLMYVVVNVWRNQEKKFLNKELAKTSITLIVFCISFLGMLLL